MSFSRTSKVPTHHTNSDLVHTIKYIRLPPALENGTFSIYFFSYSDLGFITTSIYFFSCLDLGLITAESVKCVAREVEIILA